jgi:hypothetical protein
MWRDGTELPCMRLGQGDRRAELEKSSRVTLRFSLPLNLHGDGIERRFQSSEPIPDVAHGLIEGFPRRSSTILHLARKRPPNGDRYR